ncbi:hypothetical protein F4776DRAFT_663812 [Hypoxylon sp. NC0597]|nr:hypothetical protein F4776DRAFT_663812 [Hypoxylon sp. NC0597]
MSKSPSNNDVSTSKTQEPNGRSTNVPASAASTEAEIAKAFTDLLRGEEQATALEASLTTLESKLDALLASMEADPARFDASRGKEAGPKEKESQAKK